jgi:transposase
MKNELYIGFDVHKDSITVAVAQAGRGGEVRLYGTISNDLHAIEKLLTVHTSAELSTLVGALIF